MSPIQFKLSKPPDGLVRRVTFPERPSWDILAAKIYSLYDVPPQSIGVSYIDNDGDEVTLSSDEELQDFYHSAAMQRNDGTLTLVKFNVRDLDALRDDKPLPDTPRTGTASAPYRNTFGRSAPVLFDMEVDDGWQPIPSGLAGLFNVSQQPHAFVEVLESDADISQFEKQHNSRPPSNASTNTLPELGENRGVDKGKGRARSEDLRSQSPDTISSTQSVLAAEAPPKHPIHVVAMNNPNLSTEGVFRRRGSRSRSSTGFTPLAPTPKARTPNLRPVKPADNSQEDDPPLPDLTDIPSPPSAIANDVANLFSTLSIILASHPELSEGIRNIVRNASDGTYWQTHREQVARAAEEIRRSAMLGVDELRQAATEGRRSAEDAAGRRVADALGNVIRVIADITGTQATAQPGHGAQATSTPHREQNPGNDPPSHRWEEAWYGGSSTGGPTRRGTFGGFGGRGSWDTFGSHWDRSGRFRPHPPIYQGHVPPPIPPPPPPHLGPPPSGPPPSGPPPPPPPPPPRPLGHPHGGHPFFGPSGLDRFPPGDGPDPGTHDRRMLFDNSTPQRPYNPFKGPHSHHHHSPGEWGLDDPFAPHPGQHRHYHHPSGWEDTVPALPPRPSNGGQDAEVTMYGMSTLESPDSAKKALQAAKEAYIAEKERYRRLREERKKRKMNLSTDSEMKDLDDSPISPLDVQEPIVRPVGDSSPTMPPPVSAPPQASTSSEAPRIISNARGLFPQLELYSVPPRRSQTVHATGSNHRRDASWGTFGSGAGSGPTQTGRAAAAESIVRRLGDMGFTSVQYPVLSQKIEARVSARQGEMNKEREDSIVTEIIEELLEVPPRPGPSGTRAN